MLGPPEGLGDAVGFAASALWCSSLCGAPCTPSAKAWCVRMSFACVPSSTHRLQQGLPRSYLSLSLFPRSPLLLVQAREGSQILLDPFGVWGCWSKRHVPLFCGSSPTLSCTDPVPCSVALGSVLGFPSFCQCSVLSLGGSPGKSQQWQLREWFGLRNTRSGQGHQPPCSEHRHGAPPGSVGC